MNKESLAAFKYQSENCFMRQQRSRGNAKLLVLGIFMSSTVFYIWMSIMNKCWPYESKEMCTLLMVMIINVHWHALVFIGKTLRRKCPGGVYLLILGSWDKEAQVWCLETRTTLNSDKHEVTKLFGQNHDKSLSSRETLIYYLSFFSLCISSFKKLAHHYHYLAKTVAWGLLVIVSLG